MGRLFAILAISTALVAISSAGDAFAQATRGAPAATRNFTPIEGAACRGWGRWCPPGYVRACGPYRCWCRPCW